MTYGHIKDRVLQLLNQYTVAGVDYAPTYNNQQDYLNRIPALVNDAVMEIATTVRKIPAIMLVSAVMSYEDFGDWARFEMPSDFYQFQSGSTYITDKDGHTYQTNLFRSQGRNYLLVPKKALEKDCVYTLTYYRYPRRLADHPADTDALDNAPETHEAIPFYVAAYLVIHDDAFLYASFYNKYEDKLQKMYPDVHAEVRPVDDVYGLWAPYWL